MERQKDFSELRTGWRLVLAALLGVSMGMPALPFYTIGIFAPVFSRELGWSFANIFAGLAIVTGSLVLVGPFVGLLIDRFGTRRVSSISLSCLGVSYITLAASSGSLVQYYLSWAAIAVFGLGATPVAFTRAINSAFVERRGLALGIVLSGTGMFAFVVKPLAQILIDATSWRVALVVIGAMPVLIAMPVVLWGFAGAHAKHAARSASVAAPKASVEGLTASEAFRSRPFWLLAIAFIPMSLAVAAPLPNIENILRSLHLSPAQVVQLASMVGIAIVVGRLLGGFLVDRFWAPAVGAVILSMGAVACFILSLQGVSFALAFVAVLLLGLTAGIEFDLMAFVVARYLGIRSYATVYGTLYGVFAVGAGAGPSLFGYVFDQTGSYSEIFQVCALLLIGGGATLLLLGPYPLHGAKRSGGLHQGVQPSEAEGMPVGIAGATAVDKRS